MAHMFTFSELRQKVIETLDSYKLPYEKQDANDDFFTPPTDSFEAIQIDGREEKILLPVKRNYQLLFRGQCKEWEPCLPSMYRGGSDSVDWFVDWMRIEVFRRLLESHPVVSDFFHRHHFVVDAIGLAQHYGLRTNVLDLTSELDVALFFAMCPYNETRDCYTCYIDNEEHYGYLYIVNPIEDLKAEKGFISIFRDKLRCIGLQPFARPGAQKGFALHCNEGESLRAWRYHFSFSSEDSKQYLRSFQNGESLWIKDALIDKTKKIKFQKSFSYDIFKTCFEKHKPSGFSKTKLKIAFAERDISVFDQNPDMKFSEEEKSEIIKKWNESDGESFASHIGRRTWFYYNDDKIIKNANENNPHEKRHYFRKLSQLTNMEILRTMSSSIMAPEGGTRIDYNSPSIIKTDSTGWTEVPGTLTDQILQFFLKKEDWVINKLI
jgi:hypothetical protein